MKFIFVLSAMLAMAAAATAHETDILTEWDLYKAQFGKSYDNPAEEYKRMRIFMENKKIIAEHNLRFEKGEVTFQMGINKFTDMLSQEVDDFYGLDEMARMNEMEDDSSDSIVERYTANDLQELPPYVNWVERGAVTEVRNQKTCGSCYAFAALAALESRLYLVRNKTDKHFLSVQNVVDCSTTHNNHGCKGGLARRVYEYISFNRGLNHDKIYPYEARDGKCRYKKDPSDVTILGHGTVEGLDENTLKSAVSKGPVSASFDAKPHSFKAYKSGVYSEPLCQPQNLSHAMVIVGYGTDNATQADYWLIKNSWGTEWGENGYMRLARNANNMCGVATRPVYPLV